LAVGNCVVGKRVFSAPGIVPAVFAKLHEPRRAPQTGVRLP